MLSQYDLRHSTTVIKHTKKSIYTSPQLELSTLAHFSPINKHNTIQINPHFNESITH